jgi:Xaa-Pro dipeptidase
MAFAGAVGGLVGGYLSDRYGRRPIIFCSFALASPLFFAAIHLPGLAGAVCLTLAGGVFLGSFSILTVEAQTLLPSHTGMASGLVLGFGLGVGGLLIGPLSAAAEAVRHRSRAQRARVSAAGHQHSGVAAAAVRAGRGAVRRPERHPKLTRRRLMSVSGEFGLAFPKEEYERRLAAVHRGMASRGVEVLLLFAPTNLFYLTGYNTVGYSNYQCLLVPTVGEPVLVVRLLEGPVAGATTWLSRIVTYEDHEDPAGAVRRALHEAGWASRRLGAEQTSHFLNVSKYRHLEQVLGAELVDGSGIVEAARLIKSPLELACYREAARCTRAGLEAILNAVAEGKTENEVAAEGYRGMVKAGSEFFSSQPVVTSGEKSGIAHTTFHRRVLRRGDAILIEIGAVWNRYTAPQMRTAVVGTTSPAVRKMYDACRESLEATLAAIRPGARSLDVQAACQAVIDRHGYEPNFRKRVGYSVGVGIAPDWSEGYIMDLKHHDERELRPGMVFHVVPALRQHREYAVGVSETVAVTEKGADVLTSFPRELFVRG